MKLEQTLEEQFEDRGNDHVGSAEDTPLRKDAFVLEDAEKMKRIEGNVREILLTLGLDLDDDSLKGTPKGWQKCSLRKFLEVYIPIGDRNPQPLKTSISMGKC